MNVKTLRLNIVLILALVIPSSGICGGDWEKARVISLELKSDTDYILIIKLQPAPAVLPRHESCERMEIRGTYSSWHSWLHFPKQVNRKGHTSAIEFLRAAHQNQTDINFGSMGYGLKETAQKCIFLSRALEIFTEGDTTAVLSFYDEI